MTEYAYRAGARIQKKGLSAQTVGESLEGIRTSHGGRLTPRQVVDESAPKSALLHPLFEWDNKKAADEYRLDQARHVIRSVTVKYREHDEGGPKTIRAFVNVKDDDDQHYTSTLHAMSDDELRAKVIRKAWNDLTAWRARYEELSEFATLFATMEEIQEALPPVLEAAE